MDTEDPLLRFTVGVSYAMIALGSNVGEREAHLDQAVAALRARVEVQRVSSYYETAPMYVTDQPAFINAAVLASTDLSPLGLLRLLKEIEASIGRQARERYGPREVDLDLISYGALQYRYIEKGVTRLTVPHPKIGERRFVLAPLAEIAGNATIPGMGQIEELLKQTNEQADSVVKVRDAVFHV